MQIDESFIPNANIIRSYQNRELVVALPGGKPVTRANGQQVHIRDTRTFKTSIVVTPQTIVSDLLPDSILTLAAEHIDALCQHRPELVVVGTGAQIFFPEQSLTKQLWESGIGVEFMDTAAACRTYNFLISDQRNVIAALFIG
ncbi:MAG: MTH938/NDUFAF3 family protein [Gammaproteobacteria bacterium]|nr:MTH938/NDUFAF3 family protein [Gammaproteobacteria bacterium]